MSDEATWKVEKAKYEEPGYVIVRKSKGTGDLRADLKAGLDGVAGEWIKLNKSDLGSGGAGGSYDDTALWKEIADLNDKVDNLDIPDISDLATKDQLAALQNQVTKDIADLKDHLDNHPSGGGDTNQIEEDIAALKESVADLETALEAVEDGLAQEITDRKEGDKDLQDQIDVINTQGYDDTELRGLISDEETARVEGDKVLQDQIDALEEYDDAEVRDLIKTEKDKNDEQDARLDALEAGGASGNVEGVWALASSASSAGKFEGLRNFGQDVTLGINPVDNDGDEKSFASLEAGDILNVTNQSKSGNGKYQITSVTEDMFYWRMGLTFIEGTSDSLLNGNLCNFEFEKVSGSGGDFDAAYLEEKDAEQDDRLDKIDLEQEAQNDRLDQIDLDQEEQNARLDALEAVGEGAVVGNWKRNDNAGVQGGMIGVSNFNNVTSIMLNRNDLSYQPFDFSEVEVGTTLTITNTNNTDAKGKYKVTSMEDKSSYWRIGVDTIEGTGIAQTNNVCEFSFAVAGAGGEVGDHTHDEYAEVDHTHDEYAEVDHTHDDYADKTEFETLQTDFETLQTEVEEHLTNHSDGPEEPDNVYQWTAGTSIRGEDNGKCEFLDISGDRQKVLVALNDADGMEAPKLERGDSITIKQGNYKNTFEVRTVTTERNCTVYISDYSDPNRFNSVPDEEATIIFGEQIFADHEHEDLDDRIAALEKEHGPSGPKRPFVTTTGPVNNSDGKIDLKRSMVDSTWQWILLSSKDNNGDQFTSPKVGEPFTIELSDKTITGIVTFSQYSDIMMETSNGEITITGSNDEPAIAYIGIPREDPPVGEHDHEEYVEKTEFEELEKKLDDHLNFEPGETFVYETTNYVNDWDNGKVMIHNWPDRQEVNVNTFNGDGDPVPILEVGDEMTIIFEDQKHTFTITVAEQTSKIMKYLGPEGDTEAISCYAESDRGKEVTLIFGEEPLPIADNIVTVVDGQSGPLSIWRGTKTEYELISRPSDDVLYIVLP